MANFAIRSAKLAVNAGGQAAKTPPPAAGGMQPAEHF